MSNAKLLTVIGELPAMNPEVKNKWITALRSGDYKQTQGRLKNNSGMCCLGVLCDLYHKETGRGEWKSHYDGGPLNFENQIYYAPATVQMWAGLPDAVLNNNEIFSDTKDIGSRALISNVFGQMNDELGYTFNDIADFVEKHL